MRALVQGQYLADGTSVLVNRSWNGLPEARVYAGAPLAIAADALPAAIARVADGFVDDDKAPGPARWVGTVRRKRWLPSSERA